MRSRQEGSQRSGAGRWDWTYRYGVHLLVTSVVAVVLAGGGLVAALALGGETAPCVVGRWQVVAQDQEMSVGDFRLVGQGPVVEYRADGTGLTDYGDGVVYTFTDTTLFGLGSTDVVVSGNPGCLLQITAGLEAAGHPLPVMHLVEVIDRSIDAARQNGNTTLRA